MSYAITLTVKALPQYEKCEKLIADFIRDASRLKLKIEVKSFKQEIKLSEFEKIVCDEVSQFFNDPVCRAELFFKTRRRPVITVRAIVMTKMQNGSASSTGAGKRYGLDHATALNAKKNVENFYSNEKLYQEMIQRIESRSGCKVLNLP
jgi:chromosomal replication initiation ATPase DnaA